MKVGKGIGSMVLCVGMVFNTMAAFNIDWDLYLLGMGTKGLPRSLVVDMFFLTILVRELEFSWWVGKVFLIGELLDWLV